MEPVLALLCNYADGSGGKLNAMGIGLDRIMARQVPVVVPAMALVVKMRADAAEAGRRLGIISIIDADGASVVPSLRVPVSIPAATGNAKTFGQLVINFSNVRFTKYGDYEVRVSVDGRELVSLPLSVLPPAQGRKIEQD